MLRVAVLLVTMGAAAALGWRWWSTPRPIPLERGWEASVRVLAGDGVAAMRDDDPAAAPTAAVTATAAPTTAPPAAADPAAAGPAAAAPAAAAPAAAAPAAAVPGARVPTEGVPTEGVPATAVRAAGVRAPARFSDPFAVVVGADGTVYVSDAGDAQRIRRIAPDGVVSTLAGGDRGFADGLGASARFDTPSGLAIDAHGTLYVADTGNNAIRRITPDGQVSTLAGDGTAGYFDGPAHQARFNGPIGVAVDTRGRVIVADTYNDRIRTVDPDGRVRTVAGGSAPGAIDGPGAEARFDTPSGVAVDASGTIFVADTGNGLIRTIDRASNDRASNDRAGNDRASGDRTGSNWAGSPSGGSDAGGSIAGRAHDVRRAGAARAHVAPVGSRDQQGGDRGDSDRRDGGPGGVDQRDIERGGTVATRLWGSLDALVRPIGIAVGANGDLYVTDDRGRVMELAPDGTTRTLAGSQPGFRDGPGADARFRNPTGIALAGLVVRAAAGPRAAPGAAADAGTAAGPSARPSAGRDANPGAASAAGPSAGPGAAADARMGAGLRAGLGNWFGARPAAGSGRLIVADAGNALVRVVAARSRLDFRPPAPPGIAPHFDRERFGGQPLLWPVSPMIGPHEVAGTLGEARGSEGAGRFHAGIDVRIDEGTPVLAVRDGVVAQPIATDDFGSLNEWLRLGSVSYVHIRVGRGRDGHVLDLSRFVPTYDESGALVRMRVKRGARFATGDLIGTVNPFNHVHLNVGWPGEELNPLQFGPVQFEDTIPPMIARGGVRLYDDRAQPLTRRLRGRVVISGQVQVVVDAWDQADGNRPSRRLGAYDLGYQVLTPAGIPAPGFQAVRHTLRFDRLAISPDAARLVYAPGSGIPFFGRRRTRFLYVVTNTFHGGVATEQFWDTTHLPPGPYTLRAWVADIRGNVAVANRDLPITIAAPVD